MSIDNTQIYAFQPASERREAATGTSKPGPDGSDSLPEREWGLSAGQVAAVVIAIIAASELIAVLF